MKLYRLVVAMLLVLSACQIDGTGMVLAPGWSYHSLGAWKQFMPNQMALSPHGRWIYFGSETSEFSPLAGVAALNTESGRTHVLVQGLRNVNGIRFAPDGSLWVAEGEEQGMVWRMAEPASFPDEQRVNALTHEATHPGFAPFRFAGRFAHRAIAFSSDKRFAYLANAINGGSLYRLDMQARKLAVFHRDKGWVNIIPEDAVTSAHNMAADGFASIADIERMPDGTFLLAESDTGQILKLDDHGKKPVIKSWLKHESMQHPVDLAWDESRQWWWIADAASSSTLWAWDGHHLHNIVHHQISRISGVLAAAGTVYVNLQRGPNNPSMTFILKEKRAEPE